MIPSASWGIAFHYPKHAGPEAEGSNPTTGLTLLWARNPFGGNFNHWQVSWEEAGLLLLGLPIIGRLLPLCCQAIASVVFPASCVLQLVQA